MPITAGQRDPIVRGQAGRLTADHWIERGLIPDRPLPALLAERLKTNAETRFIFHSGKGCSESTAGKLCEEALRLCAGFAGRGIAARSAIAVQLPASREHVVALLACILGGYVYIPLQLAYGPSEVGYAVGAANASVLIVPGVYRDSPYVERLPPAPTMAHLELLVQVGEGFAGRDAVAWTDLCTAPAGNFSASLQHDDIGAIIFTSGTTSAPKGVLHTYASLSAFCEVAAAYSPPDRQGFNLVAIPGIGGLCYFLRPFLHGEGAIVMEQWNGSEAADLIARYGAWWTGGSPFHLRSILDAPHPERRRSFRHCIVGGANVPPVLVEEAEVIGVRTCRTYGSSEHPVATSALDGDSLQDRSLTDGRFMPGTQVRIIGDAGQLLADGAPGEVILQGPQQFAGYLDASLNAGAFTEDGWFKSGDIGFVQNGRLTIVDRKKDMIIKGGQNISSKEVEEILCTHPDILEAAVIGWPDASYGEKVGAFLRLRPGCAVGLEDVKRHFVEAGVARFKTPELVVEIGEFPRNAGGKVLKSELRDLARAQAAPVVTAAGF